MTTTEKKPEEKPAEQAPKDQFEKIGDDAFAAALKAGKSPEEAAELAAAAARTARAQAASDATPPLVLGAAANPNAAVLTVDDAPFPGLVGSPRAMLEAFDRFEAKGRAAKSLAEFTTAVKAFAADLDALSKDVEAVSKIEPGYHDERVDVPGEGSFVVRRNGWIAGEKKFRDGLGKVELTAKAHIAGSGLGPGDQFAVEPEEAVRLVLAGGADPRQRGGVRRVAGVAGEPAAST
jgi:hypothetical protein